MIQDHRIGLEEIVEPVVRTVPVGVQHLVIKQVYEHGLDPLIPRPTATGIVLHQILGVAHGREGFVSHLLRLRHGSVLHLPGEVGDEFEDRPASLGQS